MNGPKLTGERCQCTACGEYFSSTRSFDRHRVGDFAKPGHPCTRQCTPVADLLASGWDRNPRGFLMQPDPRRAGVDVGAPRTDAAMVLHHPTSDGTQSREAA